jgi:chemotaxis protein CheX
MEEQLMRPFVDATVEVMEKMLNVTLQIGERTPKMMPFHTHDISSVISFSGTMRGVMVLSFPEPLALKFASALLGTEVVIVGPELIDAIGELANIIAGNAKKGLEGHSLEISIPSVVTGHKHVLSLRSDSTTVMAAFTFENQIFALEVCLETNKNA